MLAPVALCTRSAFAHCCSCSVVRAQPLFAAHCTLRVQAPARVLLRQSVLESALLSDFLSPCAAGRGTGRGIQNIRSVFFTSRVRSPKQGGELQGQRPWNPRLKHQSRRRLHLKCAGTAGKKVMLTGCLLPPPLTSCLQRTAGRLLSQQTPTHLWMHHHLCPDTPGECQSKQSWQHPVKAWHWLVNVCG